MYGIDGICLHSIGLTLGTAMDVKYVTIQMKNVFHV
jgi:hypothetical protein